MQPFFFRLVLLLCALAFLGGTTIGLASPMMTAADEPCPHMQGHPGHDHHHDHSAAGCFACCCVGGCIATSALQPNLTSFVPSSAYAVMYWEPGTVLNGRLIPPDTGPPKPSA